MASKMTKVSHDQVQSWICYGYSIVLQYLTDRKQEGRREQFQHLQKRRRVTASPVNVTT